MITFIELKNEVMERAKFKHHYLRLGQFVFNYMHGFYQVAQDVKDKDKVDCYYNDDLIDKFLQCCVKRLNEQNYDKEES